MTSHTSLADRLVMLLLVGAAVALGNTVRILLFVGVIIWSLAKLPWICLIHLNRLFFSGVRAVDRALAPLQVFSQKATAKWMHR
jgi:hypothetical protein